MTTTLYVTINNNMETSVMAYYLSKHFKTQVVAIDEKTTEVTQVYAIEKNSDGKTLYIIQFAYPLPEKKMDVILQYGEYRFCPEPARMLKIYIDNPNHIPEDQFVAQTRYIAATGHKYYRQLNTEDSTCYIVDKQTYIHTPLLENPFVF